MQHGKNKWRWRYLEQSSEGDDTSNNHHAPSEGATAEADRNWCNVFGSPGLSEIEYVCIYNLYRIMKKELQEGAPPYCQFLRWEFLRQSHHRRSPWLWPVHSPNLSQLYYWLWGELRPEVRNKKAGKPQESQTSGEQGGYRHGWP